MANAEVHLGMSHALEKRYPGLSVEIERIDHETVPDWDGTTAQYKGWRIDFRSLDRSDFAEYIRKRCSDRWRSC